MLDKETRALLSSYTTDIVASFEETLLAGALGYYFFLVFDEIVPEYSLLRLRIAYS